jgi:Mg2+-importing ATPase
MSSAVREQRSTLMPSAHGVPDVAELSCLTSDAALARLGASTSGLSSEEAARRLERYGANSLGVRRITVFTVMWRQLRNPLLALLLVAAVVSGLTGDPTGATIIAAIVVLSV